MTGRLINADALYTLFVKMKSFGELTAKKAIRCVEEAPTVDAIPVEWIKQFIKKDNIDIIHKVGVAHMVEQWKLHPIDFEISLEPQWIPCSDRLPKQGQEVICQCRARIIKVLKLDANGDWYQDADHCYMSGFVIAWMPLPDPYEEKEE